MIGRRTKLTPEVQTAIVQVLQAGNYQEVAAEHASIGRATYFRWLAKGEQDQRGRFRDFRDAVKRALAVAEVRDVALIAKAAEEHWQAAAWRLERKFPDRWGRRPRQERTGKDGGPIEHVVRIVRE